MPVNLNLSNESLQKIIDIEGTPLQIYDRELIVENLKEFLNKMSSNFPGFRQYFAVKALPNPHILKLLINNGCYLDCSSLTELKIAEDLGLSGEKIMFTSNYTSKEDLQFAKSLNCIINLDDISLIDDLASLGNMPELLSLRLNPGIGKTNSETKSNILGGEKSKFGISPLQILEAYSKAKNLGVKRFGLHVMTGSNVLDLSYWNELVEIIYSTIVTVSNYLDINFEFINIGGGIGIPYKEDNLKVDIESFSKNLRTSINTQLNKYKINDIRIYMENGRYITGPYGWLISKCNVIKKNIRENDIQTFYGLDACMANLMRPGMYGAYHYITISGKENENKIKANVVGTLCENNDWFAIDRELPEAKKGDLFIIHDTGAHSHSMGFQYNGKLRAPEILLTNNKYILIRRRETINDYLATIVPSTALDTGILIENDTVKYLS
jgi:diaminopimelate decarboxylase